MSRISSSSHLYILLLSASKAEIYFVRPSGTAQVQLPNSEDLQALQRIAMKSSDVPWAILVDQSEESFWGGTMPALRGAAKNAWIERMAAQSGTDSPYLWSQVQGKSRSEEGKLRVLGYTLGRHEALTPWLDALKNCGARIRGVYAPVMLAKQALDLLKIKTPKGPDDISVLVTPHEQGLRQTVLVGGLVRFSRLALHPNTEGAQWYGAVYEEIAKLREYLVGNGLLKSDRVGMQVFSVVPTTCIGMKPTTTAALHAKDQYQWVQDTLPNMVYVKALAKNQAWQQLAPILYRKRDLSIIGSRVLWIAALLVVAASAVYAAIAGSHLWQKQASIQTAKETTVLAQRQYEAVAKTFPKSPLTAVQLLELQKHWDVLKAQNPPAMRDALAAAGQVLEMHPNIVIEDIQWLADASKASGAEAEAVPAAAPAPAAPGQPVVEKKEITALAIRGMVRGIASDDLRGTRDVLAKLEEDFKRQGKLRPDITKRPLDLSAKTALIGSGTQDRSELSFEIKLWQR